QAKGSYWNAPTFAALFGVGGRLELQFHTTLNDFLGLQSEPSEEGRRLINNSLVLKWLYREGSLQRKTSWSLAAQAGVLAPNAASGSAPAASSISWSRAAGRAASCTSPPSSSTRARTTSTSSRASSGKGRRAGPSAPWRRRSPSTPSARAPRRPGR